MEFNQIHYSIKVHLVAVLLFIILSMGCMAAIAQETNGVWVLTNGPVTEPHHYGQGFWKFTGPTLSGNSITGRWDFTDTECPNGPPGYVVPAPGYVVDTVTSLVIG